MVPYEEETPTFNQTMSTEEVEALFDYQVYKHTQRDRADLMIQTELIKPSVDPNGNSNFSQAIDAVNEE